MAEVRRASRAQIVADESCWQPADLIDIDRCGAADAISIYIGKAGGIRTARRIADLAETVGLPCDVNGSLESGVGNAANLALALSSPAITLGCVIPVSVPAGSDGPATAGRYFADDVVSAPFTFADGMLHPLERPGLGIEVDEEKVRRYTPA
jgi:muconate cycloisomerase